ncbi:hypothetical protein J2W21_003578 [Sinomonas atrocyanea]|uniref:hypothetical protein n=1 Tax=Sinomonas atrocyanea TaxID=37927 RepID=UPI00278816E5|nr:hypothetical protein [Sinomonas atrocyanea]MDP9886053.1 hypothetical protein [Sinomonas atrocyanea]
MIEAWGKSIAWLGTFWVNVDTTPVITPGTVDQQSDVVWWAQNQLWWYTLVLVVFGILVGAGRLVWEQRSKHLMDIVKQLITFTLVTGSGVAVLQLLITGFDEMAKALLDNATKGTGFAQSVAGMISLTGGLGVLLAIIFGVLAILVSLVQLVMMVFRSGILILLAGGLPTAAAFTNTETGKQWFQRFLSWLIAFTLYKPAAALCYAVAFKLTASDIFASADGGVKAIVGLSLMVLALVALPALMRLVTPMVAAAAGGGGGAAAIGAAAGTLATGAIDRALSRGGRSSAAHTSSSSTTSSSSSKTDQQASGATTSPSQPKAASAAPAGASAGAAGSTGAGAAGAGAGGAGAAAGPAGVAAAVGVQAVKKGAAAVQGAAESAAGEGPSGSGGK